MLDLISKTTVLMYHVVFHLIGYNGKYVDYGTYRYPVRDYPLPLPENAPPSEKPDKHEPVSAFRALLCRCAMWLRKYLTDVLHRVDPHATTY